MGVPPRWREEAAGPGDSLREHSEREDGSGEDADGGLFGFVGQPDAPSGRHASPQGRPGRLAAVLAAAGLPFVALSVALLASMVAGVSLLVGIVAVSRIDSEKPDTVQPLAAASSPEAPEQAAPSAAVLPSSAPSNPPLALLPSASPSPEYVLTYSDQLLRVQRSSCEGTQVDLDEPRVLPPTGADLVYRACEDGPHLDLDAAGRFAVVDVPTATARDCLDAIRLNPGVGWVAPEQNVTACVLTSPTAAGVEHVPQKLVRLHVDEIDTQGTLQLSLTSWAVPPS